MKKIISQVKTFCVNDLKLTYVLTLTVFLGILIVVNYQLDFESSVLRPLKRTSFYPVYTFLFYGLPYYGAFLLYAFFYGQWRIFSNKLFWLSTLTAIGVMTFNESVYLHQLLIEKYIHPELQYFTRKCANDFLSALMYFIPMYIYWKIVDAKYQPLYGFSFQNFNVKPYLVMLACMVPLLTIASFNADFQDTYPVYKDGGFSAVVNIPEWISVVCFEFCYGADFVMVEFLFRGFMVMTLVEVIGIHAVLPMATVYCVFHFGKPAGETISSFFGGTLLGIVAYHSRSIYGGIFVHWGIAFLMEVFAFWQKS
jgi:hypothetical protein